MSEAEDEFVLPGMTGFIGFDNEVMWTLHQVEKPCERLRGRS